MRLQVQFIAAAVLFAAVAVSAQNVTQILAKYPSYSTFNRLLSETKVINEILSRSSLTLLCPTNAVLDPVAAANAQMSVQEVSDVLRYHVLLQYLDVSEIKQMNNGSGLVTTLYQTTGRAQGQLGFVNITDKPNGAVEVGPPSAGSAPQAAVITNITSYPYNYSFFEINGVLVPSGLSAAAPVPAPAAVPTPAPSPNRGPVLPPAPSPVVTAPSPSLVPTLAPTVAPVLSPVPSLSGVPSTAPVPTSGPIRSPAGSPPAPPSGPSTSYSPAASAVAPSTAKPNASSFVDCSRALLLMAVLASGLLLL